MAKNPASRSTPPGSRSKGSAGRGAAGKAGGGKGTRPGKGGAGKGGGKAVAQARKASGGGLPWGLIAGVVAIVVFAVGVVVYAALNSGSESPEARAQDLPESLQAAVQEFPLEGAVNNHVEGPVTYPQQPPVGGAHNPAWLTCGTYDQPVPNENAVHSQEHGAVWVTYSPDLAPDAVDRLQSLVRGDAYAVLSPYPGLPPGSIYASAWGLQMKATGADDPNLPLFIRAYSNGPQTPEKGATCQGGVGTPVES